jgi:hypothetical protein
MAMANSAVSAQLSSSSAESAATVSCCGNGEIEGTTRKRRLAEPAIKNRPAAALTIEGNGF